MQINIQDITNWTTHGGENHFLTYTFNNDHWMLYATGPTQDEYLKVLSAVRSYLSAPSAVANLENDLIAHPNINKQEVPNVANYWINFTPQTMQMYQTKDQARFDKILLNPHNIPEHQKEFFTRFNNSRYGMNNLSPDKIGKGFQKANGVDFAALQNRASKGKFDKWWQDNLSYFENLMNNAIWLNDFKAKFVNHMRQYSVRRACKFLLSDSIMSNKTILYALDDLDLIKIPFRTQFEERNTSGTVTFSKIPVCTTELREIFRYWDYYQKYVVFFNDFHQVTPPWEAPIANGDMIQGWARYASHLAEKNLDRLPVQNAPNNLQLSLSVTSFNECIKHFTLGRYSDAIKSYFLAKPSAYLR